MSLGKAFDTSPVFRRTPSALRGFGLHMLVDDNDPGGPQASMNGDVRAPGGPGHNHDTKVSGVELQDDTNGEPTLDLVSGSAYYVEVRMDTDTDTLRAWYHLPHGHRTPLDGRYLDPGYARHCRNWLKRGPVVFGFFGPEGRALLHYRPDPDESAKTVQARLDTRLDPVCLVHCARIEAVAPAKPRPGLILCMDRDGRCVAQFEAKRHDLEGPDRMQRLVVKQCASLRIDDATSVEPLPVARHWYSCCGGGSTGGSAPHPPS